MVEFCKNSTVFFMSKLKIVSFSIKGTSLRYIFKNDSRKGDVFIGNLKCKACDAFNNSIAKIVSILSTIVLALALT